MAKKTPQARKAASAKPVMQSKAGSKPKSSQQAAARAPKAATKPSSKSAIKPPPKSATKVPAKPVAKSSAKATTKVAPPPKVTPKASPKAPVSAGKAPLAVKVAHPVVDDKKVGRKGLTVVEAKAPAKKAKPKEKPSSIAPPGVGRLLDPKNPIRRPLIPSGPKAAQIRPLGMQGPEEDRPVVSGKSPFGKKDLAHFRQMLIRKRAELVGDVSQMENEALQGNSGATSVPQHMAEQGSDTYDQSLALDIAAADRKLIKEIDDAIKRVDHGTFGICELTGKPIKRERLEELPWARYTIEAARELERRSMWA